MYLRTLQQVFDLDGFDVTDLLLVLLLVVALVEVAKVRRSKDTDIVVEEDA
jgi:hypothetical protein